jgi:hypothetical protein
VLSPNGSSLTCIRDGVFHSFQYCAFTAHDHFDVVGRYVRLEACPEAFTPVLPHAREGMALEALPHEVLLRIWSRITSRIA